MAHGLPNGVDRIIDANGNPVNVTLQKNGQYTLATTDELVYDVLQKIHQALTKPPSRSVWDRRSPWKGNVDE